MMADGHLNTCKTCMSVKQKAYYQRNKEKLLQAGKERMKDPVRRERDKDMHAAWRANNPERWKELVARAQAKAKLNGTAARSEEGRKERVANATPKGTVVGLKAILKEHGRHCNICDLPIAENHAVQFDHVIPLARGGAHTAENLRPAHRSCNAWKGDRLPSELEGLVRPTTHEEIDLHVKELKRQRRSEKQKAIMAAMTPEQREARSAKIRAKAGRVNANRGVPRGSMNREQSPEERARRASAVKAVWAAKTPEELARHAEKIRQAKAISGS